MVQRPILQKQWKLARPLSYEQFFNARHTSGAHQLGPDETPDGRWGHTACVRVHILALTAPDMKVRSWVALQAASLCRK